MKINQDTYNTYLSALLAGNTNQCQTIFNDIMDEVEIRSIYVDLFQKSLYEVGKLWEKNAVSVATEHMATSITSLLMSQLYPRLFSSEKNNKSILITTIQNEHHQIGARMVADFFEMYQWDTRYLGADTPINDLLKSIDSYKPDAVGLSIAIFFNMNVLEKTIGEIKNQFENVEIMVGGQAFMWGGQEVLEKYNLTYFKSVVELENFLKND